MNIKMLKLHNDNLIAKYNITKSTNPSLHIKDIIVEFCVNANPLGYNHSMNEIPYWKLYFRSPKHIVDTRFDEALSLQEVIDLLKEVSYKATINAFPRLSKNCQRKYDVFESDVCINIVDKEGILIVQFDYNGKVLYFDGINTHGKERMRALVRNNYYKNKLFCKTREGNWVYINGGHYGNN